MVQQDPMEEQPIQNKPIQSTLVPSECTTLANTAKDFVWGVIPATFLLAKEKYGSQSQLDMLGSTWEK